MAILSKNFSIKFGSGKWLWSYENIISRPAWLTYFVPAVLTIAATYFKWQLFTYNAPQIPFLLYFGVIMASAAFGGTRAAIAGVIFSFLAAFFFFIYPFEGFSIKNITLMQLTGFLAESLFFVFLLDNILHTHQQLRQGEQRYRGIIEKSHEGFFMTDSDSNITYTCPSTSILLGYTEDELKQMHYYSLINPQAIDEFKTSFTKLLAIDDASLKVRHQLKAKDGSWIWVETVAKNLLNDTRINRVVYHFTNITEKVNDELNQEDFVNIASHELKNPITALIGYLYLLKGRLHENKYETSGILARMDNQVNKLHIIISDMLDITKIKAGQIQYSTTTFDLNESIKEAIDAITFNLDSHQVNCSFESFSRFIEGDKERIEQVITNLITNAVKYSPGGKKIDITTCIKANYIETKVTDYGIGIAKEKQKRLFERFYRVDTLPKKLPGLGLGLYISADIIRRHNGIIGVESEEGKGSSFWFTLPLKSVTG